MFCGDHLYYNINGPGICPDINYPGNYNINGPGIFIDSKRGIHISMQSINACTHNMQIIKLCIYTYGQFIRSYSCSACPVLRDVSTVRSLPVVSYTLLCGYCYQLLNQAPYLLAEAMTLPVT